MSAHLSPIRIVRIIDRLNIGGPAKHVTWLSAGLNPAQFETSLIAGNVSPHEGDMTDFARKADLSLTLIKEMGRELGLRDAIVVFRLFMILCQLKPNIVHTHKAKAGAVGRVAAFFYKWLTPSILWLRPRQIAVIHTYHGHIFHSYYSPAKTKLFLFIERFLAWLVTDRIIVISEQQRREINEHFGIGRARQFCVVPLGIDCDEAEQIAPTGSFRADIALKADERTIGVVGRLCAVKNHALFLQAAALLLTDPAYRDNLRFLVIGDGELRQELEEMAQQLQIADRVIFTGFRSDVVALYSEIDIIALTSLNEGTPLTLIEAMNSARPVVTTEVGGVIDILGQRQRTTNGFGIWEHGLSVPSQDAQALARAWHYLLEQPALQREMGQRGQTFVRTKLSRERLINDIEALYRNLVCNS